jgi:hypothetical protein
VDAYEYATDLCSDIVACDHEVTQYLFNGKWGIKQQEIDFDSPEENLEDFEQQPEFEGVTMSVSGDGENFKEVNMGKLRKLAETA